MHRLVAIDLGQKGAVCTFDVKEDIMEVEDIKLLNDKSLDSRWLFIKLAEWNPQVIAIENVFKPNSLVRMAGEVISIAKIIETEIKVIHPVTWMKKILGQGKSDKEASIAKCQKERPEIDLSRLTVNRKQKKKELSHDRAEAVLLALYLAEVV